MALTKISRKALQYMVALVAALLMAGLPSGAQAHEVAGVQVPEVANVGGKQLVLNGAGVRKKFFIKVYVGALYLTKNLKTVEAVLADTGPKRVSMQFIYKKVSAKSMTSGWTEGFENNLSQTEVAPLHERLKRFNSMFTDLHAGDIVRLDYIPGEGTRVFINGGSHRGTIKGADFNRALLKVWLGKSPVDKGLKAAMLQGGV